MRKLIPFGSLGILLSIAASGGCGSGDAAPSKETQEASSRLQDLKQKSGGDWNKLSQADQEYLTGIAHGSSDTAKMLLGPPKRTVPGK